MEPQAPSQPPDRASISLRLSLDDFARIQEYAAARGLPIAAAIRALTLERLSQVEEAAKA